MEVNQDRISKWRAIWALVYALVAIIIFVYVYQVIPQFSEIFSSFNADLPVITDIYIQYIDVFIGVSVVCILLAAANFIYKSKPVFVISCVLSTSLVLTLPLAIIAMYLPIFLLGQPVN